jgi:hypothetical protein
MKALMSKGEGGTDVDRNYPVAAGEDDVRIDEVREVTLAP